MKAAIELLDATPPQEGGRRIAVLGDMLELGDHAPRLHAGIAEVIGATRTDVVLTAGPLMRSLAESLPGRVEGAYRPAVAELEPVLLDAVRPGDVIMVKSSKGAGFSRLVQALLDRFPAEAGGRTPG